MRTASGVILLVLLLPIAAAVDTFHGGFTVEGGLVLPPGSKLSYSPLAAFWADASKIEQIVIHAERLRVHRYEFERQDIGPYQATTKDNSAQYELTDVTITLSGRPSSGWIGAYADQGELLLKVTTSAPTDLQPYATSVIGNTPRPDRGDAGSGAPFYARSISDPHMRAQVTGNTSLDGPLQLKVLGPGLVLDARENRTSILTGADDSPGALPTTKVERWLLLEADHATGWIVSSSPLETAAREISAESAGTVLLKGASGRASTRDHGYDAELESFSLTGHIMSEASARDHQGVPSARVALRGSIESTSLAAQPVPIGERINIPLPALLGLTAGAAVLLTGVGFRVGRHHRRERFSVDQYVSLASEAAEAGDFHEALEWTRQALLSAPTSSRLKSDEGYFLSQIGDVQSALAAYSEASRLTDDGEPEFLAAMLLIQTGAPPETAEKWLSRALERAPSLVLEILDDPTLAAMRARPAVKRSITRALRRIE